LADCRDPRRPVEPPAKGAAIAYWATLLAFLPAYLWVHHRAGLTFPIPWPDEGTFLWQALAVARDNTLLAPQINPDRHVMWMPPGYMVVQGLIFKLTGFSFAWARMLSALYLIGAVVSLAAIFRSRRSSLLYPLLCGCFLMNRSFVLMGNIARSEALLLLVVCAGFLFLHRGRLYRALALLSLSPLVHPNGLYFCAGAGVYFLTLIWRDPRRLRPARGDLPALACALLCWSAYLLYAALHWQDVIEHMGLAFTWKSQANVATAEFWRQWVEPAALCRWALLAAALVYSLRRDTVAPALLVLAFSLQVLDITTLGWMYRIHSSLLHLVLTVIWVEVLSDALGRSAARAGRLGAYALGLVLAVLALGVNFELGEIEDPRGYPTAMEVEGMRISSSPAYLEAEDLRVIGGFLRSLESGKDLIRVSVFPLGEAILLEHLESPRLKFFQPHFYDGETDVWIVHLSRHLPDALPLLPKRKILERVEGWPVLRERDGTERWLYQIEGGRPHGER
jgi:hypothetical protein